MNITEHIMESLLASEQLYHRLVLLVGKSGSGKTSLLNSLATDLGVAVINVNLELSARLLSLSSRQRALHTARLLDDLVSSCGSPVLLDNLEILFDPELRQDPLRLLQGLSRNRSIVATWSGVVDGEKLTYAISGHPEHRSYDVGETIIIDLNGTVIPTHH